jgi:hypothetical protein
MKFELSEETAHSICANLEHFLTRQHGRMPGNSRYD